MAATFTEFLLKISTDSDYCTQFRADPDAIMKAAGLTEEQRTAVLSGESDPMQSAVAAELSTAEPQDGPQSVTVQLYLATCCLQHPHPLHSGHHHHHE